MTVQQESKDIIIADFSVIKYSQLAKKLNNLSHHTVLSNDPNEFLTQIKEIHYDLCIINLLLMGLGPFELVSKIKKNSKNKNIRIIVTSKQIHKENIKNSISAGANDFIAEPFHEESLYLRVLYHLSNRKEIQTTEYELSISHQESFPLLNLLVKSTEKLAQTGRLDSQKVFFSILSELAKYLKSNRTSMILVEKQPEESLLNQKKEEQEEAKSTSKTGLVVSSSDDPNFYDFVIDLDKYPEVQHVVLTGDFVLIEDISENHMTKHIKNELKNIRIGSILVFPIRHHGDVIGVLTIKRPQTKDMPSFEELRIIQAIANTLASHSNSKAVLRKFWNRYQNKLSA